MNKNENTLGPHRYSEVLYGVWVLGAVGWPLRASEDTQNCCGGRESYEKNINLGNLGYGKKE